MSKKKNRYFRNIIVDGKKYVWKISHYNCDGDGGSKFNIWNENKKLFYEDIVHHPTIITPKIVELKIRKYNKIGFKYYE